MFRPSYTQQDLRTLLLPLAVQCREMHACDAAAAALFPRAADFRAGASASVDRDRRVTRWERAVLALTLTTLWQRPRRLCNLTENCADFDFAKTWLHLWAASSGLLPAQHIPSHSSAPSGSWRTCPRMSFCPRRLPAWTGSLGYGWYAPKLLRWNLANRYVDF